jgi:hypothetical protein
MPIKYINGIKVINSMFKKNTKHTQADIFGLFNTLPERMKKKIEKSEEHTFYRLIFCNIKEDIFSKLYSDAKSRPNAPINALVSSLTLMHRYNWTYEELFKNIEFNILTKIALGLDSIDKMPFCPATLFNFQNRLSKHFSETGEILLEKVFEKLTDKQLKTLKIKTNIQRTDSLAAASNIRNYTRLQLLVELLLRIYRVLSDEDKKRFEEHFEPYIRKTSGQYIYPLRASDIPHEIEKIAKVYYWIDQNLKLSYTDCEIFKTFERVYSEQFTVVQQAVEIKPPDQIPSSSVQSPDDLDATYRKKNSKEFKGQSINIVETAHPDNPVNLITDVSTNPVNKDDGKVLNERLDTIKEKSPDLNELHFDGAYGSSENDKKFEQHKITPVQTAVRGVKPGVDIEIEKVSESEYKVSCPLQSVTSEPTRKRHKAIFELALCKDCSQRNKCQTIERKSYRAFYFTHDYYLSNKRQKVIDSIPVERRKLRSNVEATVKEFVCKMPNRKLKVRGAFKTSIFAFSVALSINFGRIYRLIQVDSSYFAWVSLYFARIVKEQSQFFENILAYCVNIRFSIELRSYFRKIIPNPYILKT